MARVSASGGVHGWLRRLSRSGILLDTDGYRQAALAAGADEFVPKATLITELIPAIRRAAEASRLREVTAGTRHSGAPVTEEPRPDRSAF